MKELRQWKRVPLDNISHVTPIEAPSYIGSGGNTRDESYLHSCIQYKIKQDGRYAVKAVYTVLRLTLEGKGSSLPLSLGNRRRVQTNLIQLHDAYRAMLG